jgi:hypothetical protein
MWVNGKSFAINFTQRDDPSRENQTSDKNIMGQEIKFTTPLVNSSLVPLAAITSPNALRHMPPVKKMTKRSK